MKFVPSLCAVSLALLIGAVTGCSSSAAGESIKGKVTLGDKPVSGMIVFTGADGKEASAPISADGAYSVSNPSHGALKITITSMGPGPVKGVPSAVKPKNDGVLPALPTEGIPPPAKYSKPDNGLTYDFKGGLQTFDLELKP